MRPIFLQVTSEDPEHLGMIRDNLRRHLAYCEKWGYKYEHLIIPDFTPWKRLRAILDRLGEYSHVFCMDSDVFVANFNYNMRSTLPDWSFYAATIHPYPWREQRVFHVQCGGFYFRDTRRSSHFIHDVLRYEHTMEDDQSAVNHILLGYPSLNYQDGFNILPCSWNQTVQDCDFETSAPIVAAFHGTPVDIGGGEISYEAKYRRILMRKYAERFPYE